MPLGIIGFGRVGDPLLPRWVAHHAGQVGAEHLLLLLTGERAGLQPPGCAVHVLPGELDEDDWWQAVNGFATGLLSAYGAMAGLRIEEFLLADPGRYADLTALVADRADAEAIGCSGHELTVPVEVVAQRGRPLLGPEARLRRDPALDRPVLRAVEHEWEDRGRGFPVPVRTDAALLLLRVTPGRPAGEGTDGGAGAGDREGRPIPGPLLGLL